MYKLYNENFLNIDNSEFPPVNVIANSPPFNVGIPYKDHVDTMSYDDYLKWSEQWIKKCYDIQPDDGRIIINLPFTTTPVHLKKKKGEDATNYPVSSDIINVCKSVGYKYYRTVVWKKLGSSKTCWGSFKSASCPLIIDPSESLIIFYKKQWKRLTKGTSTVTNKEFLTYIKNVWEIGAETKSKHPAAYPTTLTDAVIKMFSYKEDTVMDNFLGSGTTGVSAINLGRNFIGTEISKEYYTMAKDRLDKAYAQAEILKQTILNDPIDNKPENNW